MSLLAGSISGLRRFRSALLAYRQPASPALAARLSLVHPLCIWGGNVNAPAAAPSRVAQGVRLFEPENGPCPLNTLSNANRGKQMHQNGPSPER